MGDVIVGGVAPPPGDTLWEQRSFIERDDSLRRFMLNEPRGGVFRHVNLLVPAKDPRAQMGMIIMEPADTPPMSGSNSICVATVLLETGIVPITGPQTDLLLEAPGGLVKARAFCRDGKAERIVLTNVPSFVDQLAVPLEVPGLGTLTVHTAYGGDSFVIVDAQAVGIEIVQANARDLAETGVRITAAADEQLGFRHPLNAAWKHISFCQFAGPLTQVDGELTGGQRGGDTSPARSTARRPAPVARHAWRSCTPRAGCASVTFAWRAPSSAVNLSARLNAEVTSVGGTSGYRTDVSGRAWITGTHQHTLDPTTPGPKVTGSRIPGRRWRSEAVLILTATDLQKLGVTTAEVVRAMEQLLMQQAQGRAWIAPKTHLATADDRYMMATLAAADDPPFMAVKALLINPANPQRDLSVINSSITLLDSVSGLPMAVLDGNWVTALRTAGASALVAKRLANAGSAVLALIGCGVQARSHLQAYAELFPLREVRAFSGRQNRDALFKGCGRAWSEGHCV